MTFAALSSRRGNLQPLYRYRLKQIPWWNQKPVCCKLNLNSKKAALIELIDFKGPKQNPNQSWVDSRFNLILRYTLRVRLERTFKTDVQNVSLISRTMTCDVSTQGRTAGKASRKNAAWEWESGNENSPRSADTTRNEDTLAARLSESYLSCSHSNDRRLGNLMKK